MRSKILLPTGLLAAALAAGGCVSSSDIEGLHSQISDVQSQVQAAKVQAPSKQDVAALDAQVSRQMESLLKTEADMQVKLQSLTSHIDELQSKLEDTNYRLSQLSQQIAATNQELKGSRGAAPVPAPGDLGAPPAAGGPRSGAPAGATTGAAPSQVVNDPKALYDSAYNDYLKGNYDLAMREFQEYLNDFPDTDLASNATYWIGESYYRQKKYRQAADQFDQVLQRYPHSEKRASALLKKGYAQLALGERSAGVASLRQVVRQHPTSDEANLARQRLRELGG
jgi:tol-pal system protein YbgF